MSFTIQHFQSKRSTKWCWPLKVSVGAETSLFQNLETAFWSKPFCEIKYQSYFDNHVIPVNIRLYMVNNLDTFYNQVRRLYLPTDVVFFIVPSLPSLDNTHLSQWLEKQSLLNGIFIFSINGEITEWFNKFLIELSHNNNVTDALKQTCNEGYFLYDKKLEKETTLGNVIESVKYILARIKKGEIETPFGIYSDILPQHEIDFLNSPLENHHFDRESDEALRLASIAKQIFEIADYYIEQYRLGGPSGPGTACSGTTAGGSTGPAGDGWGGNRGEGLGGQSRGPGSTQSSGTTAGGTRPTFETSSPPLVSLRNLQGVLTIVGGNGQTLEEHLEPKRTYNIDIFIGPPTKGSIIADKRFADEVVFEDSTKQKEKIVVIFRPKAGSSLQFGEISLPRSGNSTRAFFTFSTNTENTFDAEVYAFHKNRLIQQAILTAAVKEVTDNTPTEKIKLHVEFCVRKDLTNLNERTEFGTSLLYETDTENGSSIRGITNNKPIDLYYNQGLETLVNDIKKYIQAAALDIESYPNDLHNPQNVILLRRLAFKGRQLFVNHLEKNENLKGPFQIITKRKEYIPLDFVYTLPPPAKTATLCSHAKEALEEGACKNCFDKSQDPSPHICPFGFWCFSEVIERFHIKKEYKGSGDYCLQSEPGESRGIINILQNTLYASTEKVETTTTKGIREELLKAVKNSSLQFHEANDWNNWSVLTGQYKPDSLVLVVHIETDEENDVEEIEIGKKNRIPQINFNASMIKVGDVKNTPFVIVIGCESTNIKNYGFDFSTQLMYEGAPIVISNFTKIKGVQAVPLVIKLIEFLKKNTGEGLSLGQIVLKLRQYLLSKGIMVGLALVVQGDADWKIKAHF